METCRRNAARRWALTLLATAIAPVPLASFAGQPSSSIGVAFLKSYAAICLEGCVIVLACVIFSAFASSPPAIADDSLRVYQMENIRENKRDDKIISCRFTVCLGRDIK